MKRNLSVDSLRIRLFYSLNQAAAFSNLSRNSFVSAWNSVLAEMGILSENELASKILVVGAGGIGCELLKNLVLTGFRSIDVVDLDTIDVSNLNRQFLFHKEHVGQSKAKVATESVLRFAPDAKIKHFHNSIMISDFNEDFFKEYAIVLNALDNRAARNHVNRMCLSADVPLIESGSAGYLGQVTVIKKGQSECYECAEKAGQKTYPGCTIRNTPSEPIHCIVWSKHLFNQLFGEADIDEEVSPDMTDPELAKKDGAENGEKEKEEESKGTDERMNTRKWAEDNKYDPEILFKKLFTDDITYLLSMEDLWKKRRPPTPLDWNNVPKEAAGSSLTVGQGDGGLRDKRMWTPLECRNFFTSAVEQLRDRVAKLPEGTFLDWDKDDDMCMDFVTACSNLRSFIFGIPLKTRFDIKSMAGNIIPAIATTNAVVAAMIVMEATKVLRGNFDQCKSIFVVRKPNPRGKILVDMQLEKPRPKCFVCSEKPQVVIELNVKEMTVKALEDKVIKGTLHFVEPDVNLDDASGTIIITSEKGETEHLQQKKLEDVKVMNGTRMICDDFLQKLELRLIVRHNDEMHEDEFKLLTDISELKAEALEEEKTDQQKEEDDGIMEVSSGETAAAAGANGSGENGVRGDQLKRGAGGDAGAGQETVAKKARLQES